MQAKVLFCLLLMTTAVAEAQSLNSYRRAADAIPGEYIVRLVNRAPQSVPGIARSIASAYGGEIMNIFDHGLGGFSLRMAPELVETLAADPRVEFIEDNARFQLEVDRLSGFHSASGGSWYLDRIDGTMDGYYKYCTTGKNVYAYVVDSGVDKDAVWSDSFGEHQAFYQGQVEPGENKVTTSGQGTADDPCPGLAYGWHGTAVAAVLASTKFGVAPDTKIIPVRVLTCAGSLTTDGALSGLHWVITNDIATGKRPAVVNISWWSALKMYSPNLYDSIEVIVDDIISRGITVVASANNYPMVNTCDRSPASLGRYGPGKEGRTKDGTSVFVPARVITVGGTMLGNGKHAPDTTTTGDYRWQEYKNAPGTAMHNTPWDARPDRDYTAARDKGSTLGQCVSVWAPARNIRVIHHYSSVEEYASGTSFSAPQVAGMIARYLQRYPTATVEQVWTFVKDHATTFVNDEQQSPWGVGGQSLFTWDDYCSSRNRLVN